MTNDTLKRKIYANKIAEEIESHYSSEKDSGHKDNIVFAISGKWGEGKTALLDLLEPKLIEKGFEVIRFNPWQYSHEDISLKRAFLREVKKKLKSEVDLNDLYYDRNETKIAWKNIIPFLKGALTFLFVVVFIIPVIFQYPLNTWLANLATISKNFWGSGIGGVILTLLVIPLLIKTITITSRAAQVTTAEEFEDKFLELLSGRSKIVIFIDDLDRCTPKTVKVILDSLRTFFRHPECSYVITGDHTVIEKYAAEELGTKDPEEGRRFLKKLFDVYWRLPLATPKVFKEFLMDEIKGSGITLSDTQDKNIKNFLLDDGFFERNPRHVKRFITALRFALESVKAQLEELSQNSSSTNDNEGIEDQKESIKEITDNPDLLAKILLIQEKLYAAYEKLILYPAEIANHEKSLRGDGKSEELMIGGKTVLEILGNDKEALKNYVGIINLEPQFTDANNSIIYDPTNFLAFSGATGLPSLKGPDEANFPQYIKAGQLVERLGSNLEALPKEKRERFAQRALQIFDDKATTEQEKVNVISESLKEAAELDEWAATLEQWKVKLFALPAPQQNQLTKDFWTAILQKSPNLLSKIKTEKPTYFEQLWPILESSEVAKLHSDTKPEMEKLLKESISATPLNLKGTKAYLDKFGLSKILEEEIKVKLVDPQTAKTYLEHCQSLGDPDGKIAKIVLLKLKSFVEDFANIDWVTQNRDFLKNVGVFNNVKNKLSQWSKDHKQLVKLASMRGLLELSDQESEILKNQAVEFIHKSADLQFIEDGNIQAILDKESKKRIFENLAAVLVDKDEALEKRKKAAALLDKGNSLWSGMDSNDVYDFLKQVKKSKIVKAPDLKDSPKAILDSWGYDDTNKKDEEK